MLLSFPFISFLFSFFASFTPLFNCLVIILFKLFPYCLSSVTLPQFFRPFIHPSTGHLRKKKGNSSQLCGQINHSFIVRACVRQSSIYDYLNRNLINVCCSFVFVLLPFNFSNWFKVGLQVSSHSDKISLLNYFLSLFLVWDNWFYNTVLFLDCTDQLIMMDFQLSKAADCKILLYYLRDW